MEATFRRVKTHTNVRSVSRALALLSALGKEGRSLTELGLAVGISPSTASRLLNTLQAEQFVGHTHGNKYSSGNRINVAPPSH